MIKIISLLLSLSIASLANPYTLHEVVNKNHQNSTKIKFSDRDIWVSNETIVSNKDIISLKASSQDSTILEGILNEEATIRLSKISSKLKLKNGQLAAKLNGQIFYVVTINHTLGSRFVITLPDFYTVGDIKHLLKSIENNKK